MDITEEHRDHAGCNLAYGTFIGSNDGKGKKKKSLCQLMNKSLAGSRMNSVLKTKKGKEIWKFSAESNPNILLFIC